jgi:hypothetical protein
MSSWLSDDTHRGPPRLTMVGRSAFLNRYPVATALGTDLLLVELI